MKNLLSAFLATVFSSALLFSAAASADDCFKQPSSGEKTAGQIVDESYND